MLLLFYDNRALEMKLIYERLRIITRFKKKSSKSHPNLLPELDKEKIYDVKMPYKLFFCFFNSKISEGNVFSRTTFNVKKSEEQNVKKIPDLRFISIDLYIEVFAARILPRVG